MNLEEFREYYESRSWLRKKFWYVRGRVKEIPRLPGKIKNIYQRARYGVGYQDAWSLDMHLARVIDKGARHLYEANNTYPGEHNGWTEQQWRVFLKELSIAAEVYADEAHNDNHFVEMFRELLHTMVDNFEMMWD